MLPTISQRQTIIIPDPDAGIESDLQPNFVMLPHPEQDSPTDSAARYGRGPAQHRHRAPTGRKILLGFASALLTILIGALVAVIAGASTAALVMMFFTAGSAAAITGRLYKKWRYRKAARGSASLNIS